MKKPEIAYLGWFGGMMMGLGFGGGTRAVDLSAWATQDQMLLAGALLFIGGAILFQITYHYFAKE